MTHSRRDVLKAAAGAALLGSVPTVIQAEAPPPQPPPMLPRFFPHDELMEMLNTAKVKWHWDFYTSEADTVKEKYEDLLDAVTRASFARLAHCTPESLRDQCWPGWVACNPEVASVFMTTSRFEPDKRYTGHGYDPQLTGQFTAKIDQHLKITGPLMPLEAIPSPMSRSRDSEFYACATPGIAKGETKTIKIGVLHKRWFL